MGASFELRAEGQIIIITVADPVARADIMDALDEATLQATPGFSLLIDASGVTHPSIDPDGVRAFVRHAQQRPQFRGQRAAIVPPPGAVNYGFSRMFQTLVSDEREVALFETWDGALAWLTQPPTTGQATAPNP